MNGYLYIILSLLFFSSNSIFARIIDLPVMHLLFLRYFFTLLCIFIYVKFSKEKLEWTVLKNTQLLIVGVVFSISSIFFYLALRNTTIAISNVLFNTAPIFIFIFSLVLLKEKLKFYSFLSLILSFVGILIVLAPDLTTFSGSLFGVIMALLTGLTYALGTVIAKGLRNISSTMMTFANILVGSCMFFPFIVMETSLFNVQNIILSSFLGIFSFAAFIFFYKSLKLLPAHHVGIMTYLEMVFAVILAVPFFGEYPTITTLIGGLLIVAGTSMLVLKKAEG